MKKYLPLLLIALAAFFGVEQFVPKDNTAHDASPAQATAAQADNGAIAEAYRSQAHDVPVHGQGKVAKMLADDTKGSRHQRFLLRLTSGQTVLVAHNIDLAPRIPKLHKGDTVQFSGVYEWNAQGGVIHWTHRDPGGRHRGGWLEHSGNRYQ